jgi:hypothetical protein
LLSTPLKQAKIHVVFALLKDGIGYFKDETIPLMELNVIFE